MRDEKTGLDQVVISTQICSCKGLFMRTSYIGMFKNRDSIFSGKNLITQ